MDQKQTPRRTRRHRYRIVATLLLLQQTSDEHSARRSSVNGFGAHTIHRIDPSGHQRMAAGSRSEQERTGEERPVCAISTTLVLTAQ
jgi:hypothetical protein